MLKHRLDVLVTNDKPLLTYWKKCETDGEPLPYTIISADDFLVSFTSFYGMSEEDIKKIYSFQESYLIKKYNEADLCGALDKTKNGNSPSRFAQYLRERIIPRLM